MNNVKAELTANLKLFADSASQLPHCVTPHLKYMQALHASFLPDNIHRNIKITTLTKTE